LIGVPPDPAVVAAVMELGGLEPCVQLLRAHDGEVVFCALSVLDAVLRCHPRGAQVVEAAGGLDAIDQVHYNTTAPENLTLLAARIVDEFFGDDYNSESGLEDDGLAPTSAPASAFREASQEVGAGRGRLMNLPAWMTQEGGAAGIPPR
jgi:hypothetical protein